MPVRLLPRLAGLAASALVCNLGTLHSQEAARADDALIVHVLNRLTFGPKPGEVDAVRQMGVRAFIEQQLHPDTIDDSTVDQELARYDLLQLSEADLGKLFSDEEKMRKEEQRRKAQAAALNSATPVGTVPAGAAMDNPGTMAVPSAQTNATAIVPEAPTETPQQLRRKPDKIADAVAKAARVRTVAAIGQIENAKLVRAIDSNRQLQEVLVDFWENHFNVDVKKGPDRILEIVEDRDVIRPHIWGRFRDLLEATAKSPAMLHYLDNATNTVARMQSPRERQLIALRLQQMGMPAPAGEMPEDGQPKKVGGINENYGREIMELHTIGVDAGYTQQDVQEVARCFTGWTFDRLTNAFVFRPRQHDNGAKTVLGHEIPADGGIQDAETVMDLLCASPACAHFIAREMCQRFVADEPPPALVERIAGIFSSTQGDLRAVTEAILTSPEFLSPASFGSKIKSPLEFAVSAVRASAATLRPPPEPWATLTPPLEGAGVLGRANAADRLSRAKKQSLNWHLVELGEPLFACTPPTGYGENSQKWVSPGALIERLNFALALTQQQVNDVDFDAKKILADTDLDQPDRVLDRCVAALLPDHLSASTRQVLLAHAVPAPGTSDVVNPNKLIALILGSPEFQRK